MEGIRSIGDVELAEILKNSRTVKRAIEQREKNKTDETRRYLLSTSVRIAKSMAPGLHEATAHCCEVLEIEEPFELYISPNPNFNAFSYGSDRGIAFIGVTSSLLEAFPPEELRFVIGHELGHYKFNHHEIPVHAVLKSGEVKAEQALQLFSWQRYAEISADRAGLLCSADVNVVANAFFRIASGLRDRKLSFDIDEYLSQIGDIQSEATRARKSDIKNEAPRADWFTSHPFSPLRIRAAQIASNSVLCKPDGMTIESLERQVAELMSIMDPSYLVDKSVTGEAMRRLLFAGGVLVSAAVDDITAKERNALESFLGQGNVPMTLNPEALRNDLDSRVENALEHVPSLKLAQVVRDLCVIAYADGSTEEEEVGVIRDIASRLKLASDLVDRSLEEAGRDLD